MTKGHFTLDELRACAKGDDGTLIDLVAEHCRACAECGDQLAVFLALNDLASHRMRIANRVPALAAQAALAALLLAVVGVVAFQFLAPASEKANEFQVLATTTPPPLAMVRFQLGAASLIDSDDTQGRLQGAGQLLAEGLFEQAAAELERLHGERPDSAVIAGYLGTALYLLGDNASRVGEFLAAGARDEDRPIAASCKWYLANYLLRTGDAHGARALLTELAATRDLRGRQSKELLSQLDKLSRH